MADGGARENRFGSRSTWVRIPRPPLLTASGSCHDEAMARFRKGDRVLITEGDFKGQWAVIVDKDIIGDELTVALGEGGREIRTHEAHVEPAD